MLIFTSITLVSALILGGGYIVYNLYYERSALNQEKENLQMELQLALQEMNSIKEKLTIALNNPSPSASQQDEIKKLEQALIDAQKKVQTSYKKLEVHTAAQQKQESQPATQTTGTNIVINNQGPAKTQTPSSTAQKTAQQPTQRRSLPPQQAEEIKKEIKEISQKVTATKNIDAVIQNNPQLKERYEKEKLSIPQPSKESENYDMEDQDDRAEVKEQLDSMVETQRKVLLDEQLKAQQRQIREEIIRQTKEMIGSL